MQPAIYLAAVSRYHSYINSAEQIFQSYKGEEPFTSFLKKYFSVNKKFGSKDRKHVSHLCYCYFRLGKAAMSLTTEERILAGLFLCSNESNEILEALKPGWNEKIHLSINEKLLIINYLPVGKQVHLLITDIFPWQNEISEEIDHKKFCESFLIQPDVFLRLRPGQEKVVIEKLKGSKTNLKIISSTCLALPNSSKIDEVIELDKEAVIQDHSSQKIGEFIKSQISNFKSQIKVWDCCAASGGKSIMTYDLNPNIQLAVSDIRESILFNLKKRFARAGIKHYKSFVADLTKDQSQILNLKSEIIICDAPCTGSGTWSRTPEQLFFFNESEIKKYASLQKKIVSNVIPQLQNGGSFIYITCSVFKKENEEVAEYIKQNFHLQVKQMEVLKGYDKKADSMFIAVFQKL